jgi:putative heme-binding domain-containing protein
MRLVAFSGCLFILLRTLPVSLAAQTPQWIWTDTDAAQTVFFRKTFRTPPLIWNSRLTLAVDDHAEIFLNGVSIGECRGPQQPIRTEVTVRLNQGENVIAVRAENRFGPAGLLVQLNLGGQTNLFSDASWLVSTNEERAWNTLAFNAAHWRTARVLGTNGIAPWGNVFAIASATSAEALSVPPDFKVELLRSAAPNEGSWICMAFDPAGRLVISPQGDDRPLLRLTLTNGAVARIEPFSAPIRYAMGLLFAHDSLYASARVAGVAGLYRLRDLNGNDAFETNEVQLLKKFEGGSEHGYHALALGPDKRIYVLNGNGTKLPAGLSARSPHRHYREDVLSLNPDEREKSPTPAPAGYVLRTDADGKEWELWMGGLRNAYDFDFNTDGELFAFDSDMEWDWGMPWYRPTRIVHCVSGAEFGWRDGTRLWPDYYEDSLPGAVEVGIGSPTGVKFGTRSRFPEKYRRALFACDWSYGRIFAIHLTPDGATYRGKVETFLHGTPLNLTDIEFGPDGAMYFITGGRGTQSGLYRVSYLGKAGTTELVGNKDGSRSARSLRHELERLHGVNDSSAVSFVWPHLSSSDRFIRYAVRIALESQDVALWRERAFRETNVTAGLNALVALARLDSTNTQPTILKALARFPPSSLTEEQMLMKLRALQLSCLRQGRPEDELARVLVAELNGAFPAKSWPVNRELSRLLIYLEAPDVIPKTLDLLDRAPTQEEQFHYIAQLRHLRHGWTLDMRRQFFQWWLKPRHSLQHTAGLTQWFADVGRTYVDGAEVDKYLRQFRADALATLTPEERRELEPLLAQPFEKARLIPTTPRAFVRAWVVNELLPSLEQVVANRNFERGRRLFAEAQCLSCHRFGNDGGSTGPELTGAGSKYDARSLLESILEPSKVINEQYAMTVVEQSDETLTGRIVSESKDEIMLEVDPLNGTRETIARKNVKSRRPSTVSSMPQGLLNTFSQDEILDLVAYLQSGGRSDAAAFLKR